MNRYLRWNILGMLLLVGVMLLAGCAPAVLSSTKTTVPSAPSTAAAIESTAAATEVVSAEEPTPIVVRQELEATDPTSVQLASGEVQLVEFFAFW